MQSTNIPQKTLIPFGSSGPRNTIPVPSQIGVVAGAASFTDGFPPLTMTDPLAGGIPPDGKDMNGILYAISQAIQWMDAGGALPQFDAAFATAIGGYPTGAVLQSADGQGLWVSVIENNTVNPDTGAFGNWVPVISYGLFNPTLGASNITLTPAQASKGLVVLTGTLTANVTLTFPTWNKEWLIVNSTSGAFNVFAKTATGAAVTIAPGANLVYGSFGNIFNCDFLTSGGFTTQQSLVTNGYQKSPGGLITQWGYVPVSNGTFTFPIPFPNACLNFLASNANSMGASTDPAFGYPVNASTFFCATKQVGGGTSNFAIYWSAIGH